MVTINFYSYKGGVGRTMLTMQIARLLAALGERVVVIDLDFDAPGVPGMFDIENSSIGNGIYNLASDYPTNSRPNPDYFSTFRDRLHECLLDVPIVLKGIDKKRKNCGEIKILPFAHLDATYANTIVDLETLRVLHPTQTDFLKQIKNELSGYFDYLLIDSRSGLNYYASIARQLSERLVLLFCPNRESKVALQEVLLPALKDFNPRPERLVFVASRIPPELNNSLPDSEWPFSHIESFINDNCHNDHATLKLHSDLETHLHPRFRAFDDQLNDVVQMHEDILKIFIALYNDRVSATMPFEIQSNTIWRSIYGRDFEITHRNRLFKFLDSVGGWMVNMDDVNRNVAFRVDTFTKILNVIYNEDDNANTSRSLFSVGSSCGSSFGSELSDYWNRTGKIYNRDVWINDWCGFDTDVGFAKLEYEATTSTLRARNLFIRNTIAASDYTSFFTGYAESLLQALLCTPCRLEETLKTEDVIEYTIIFQ